MRFPILGALVLMCFAADAATVCMVTLIDDPELTAIVSDER